MIFNSTPGSITWGLDESHQITFHGEWTLEPKFYLNLTEKIYWNGPKPRVLLSEAELKNALALFVEDTKQKGWRIVFDSGAFEKNDI